MNPNGGSAPRARTAAWVYPRSSARVWDRQNKFRIQLGPLGIADYRRMLPGGESLARLVAIVRNYLGDELEWDLNLVLRREETPPIKLGGQGQLGCTTWLASRAPERDRDDLKLNPMRTAARSV